MKWILSFLFIFLNFNAFGNNPDPVVAEVEGTPIKKSTLLSYHKQNLNYVQNDRKVTLERSLNDLIDRIIGVKAGKRVSIDKRPEVLKKINDVIYHAYISDELTPKLQKIKVTDKEIEKYYKQYPEYKTSQILLRLRTLPSEEDVAGALETAVEIYNQVIKKPSSFAALAQQYSQTTTATVGGDMGYQPKVKLATEYYDNIKGKKKGYITKPFRTQFGIHIVMVTGEKEFKQIDKELYKKIIFEQKRDALLANYFADKRKSSKIKIYKDELLNE